MPIDDYLAQYGGKEFPLPSIAGTCNGKGLVICADGHTVWDDLEKLGAKCTHRRGSVVAPKNWEFMVVNKLGETFPGTITHWYSNEFPLLQAFVAARRYEYRKEFPTAGHTHSITKGAKWHWPFAGQGTSGLTACLVGIALGYDKIILCGMPLDNGPHNGEPPWRKCHFEKEEAANQKNGQMPMHWWRAKHSAFDGKVTSMSGRTREWLGSPAGF